MLIRRVHKALSVSLELVTLSSSPITSATLSSLLCCIHDLTKNRPPFLPFFILRDTQLMYAQELVLAIILIFQKLSLSWRI
jgi:hypothetical protein